MVVGWEVLGARRLWDWLAGVRQSGSGVTGRPNNDRMRFQSVLTICIGVSIKTFGAPAP